ncbi:MAG TPA: triple tyrosine motif-containing protein [Cyclobacteriaceae bacterium]|nr:hypothetical protein [Cytophagales bacterium]HRE66834.1 triple tyrosine motif-containing protein [Cyclobacteriaceae bacterium]HRF33228.1 triple tyrosine motif-containing protein [Cyclobacteriaceae bacterium]
MRATLQIVCLWLISFCLQAQTGTYYLSHFTPPDDRIDFRSRFMLQDTQGELYFANRQGILEFDGKNWNEIEIPGAVHAVAANGTDVYVAGVAGGGKLNKKSEPQRAYIPLVAGNFNGVAAQGELVFFLASDQVIAFSSQTNQVSWALKADSSYGIFLELFTINNAIYLRTSNRGLQKLQDQKLSAAEFAPANVVFASPGKSVLLGMDDNRVFVLEKNQIRELVLKDSTYLPKHTLVAGTWLNNNLIALGTMRGGVLFINATTGETEQVVDYFNGLPDNEVYALLADGNDGVWVSHEYGFTRIAPQIPFRSFDHFSGLNGNLLCAQTFNGNVFVGTTLGLFELVNVAEIHQPVVTEVATSRGRRKATPAPIPKVELPGQPRFEYQRVAGIEGKVTQLAIVNSKLMAAGVSGLFEVSGLTSKPILMGAVRTVFYSPSLNQLLVAIPQQTKTLQQVETNWQETQLLDSIREPISHAFEDRLENIWLCGKSYIYKIETVDGDITDLESIPINNPSRDETVGLAYGNEVYIAASGQFSIYDHKASFVKFDSLPGPRKYFASGGYFWFNDGTRWRTVDSRVQSLKLEWLGMFPNLRYLAPDQAGNNVWVITAANELYNFSQTAAVPDTGYPLYLRGIRGHEISLADKIEIEEHEGAITFEFIQPAYLGLNATQYRYQVKELNKQWSSWSSSNNEVAFSYLPPGKYQLQVQSRDLLGNVSKVEQIAFKVLPPYWKRWWFYALEFTVFSLLVALSLRIGRANTRYRFVSQILSLLTVVMLVQFLQTAISSLIGIKTSPVIEFIIQVFVALAIFPVEILARDSMMKYVEGKYRIRRIWERDK